MRGTVRRPCPNLVSEDFSQRGSAPSVGPEDAEGKLTMRSWWSKLWQASVGQTFLSALRGQTGMSTPPRRGPRPRPRHTAARLLVEPLEDRTVLAGNTLATAVPVGLNSTLAEQITTSNETDFFQVAVTESGLLTVQTQPAPGVSLASRLSLLGPDGQPLVQSDGAAVGQPGGSISQHLVAGADRKSVV